jgi:LmbE family N-acetylglucosaminyl deacetylase
MTTPTTPTTTTDRQAEYDRILDTVKGLGSHGQVVDVRETLRYVLGPNRPLVMLCPHADDGAITAACLLHEYAVRRGLPVVEVLVFAGERNVAAPWLNDQKKISVREAEFRLECSVLGAEAVCWNLDAYRAPGYIPSRADVSKVVDWFIKRRPGAIIVPPANDAHAAHRVTRALGAIGLLGASLADTLVLTGWTPWGPLPEANAYFSYDGEAERTKEWAIHCHASQVLLTDYTQFCSHLGRAYAALAREWAEGHSLSGRAHRTDDRFVGVEMYQVESFDPDRCKNTPCDPIQMALGILGGKIPRQDGGLEGDVEPPPAPSTTKLNAAPVGPL